MSHAAELQAALTGYTLPEVLAAFAAVNPESATTDAERQAARDEYHTDECNIDEDALASRDGEGNLWVLAWVWVNAEMLGTEEEEPAP